MELQELLRLLKLTQDEVKELVIKKAKKNRMEIIEIKGGIIINPEGKTLLSSHMDTVAPKPPKLVFQGQKGEILIGLNEKGKRQILGGDDRAGVWIMLKLIDEGIKEYSYAFFEDEEIGCVGSRNAVKNFDFGIYNCFIGLDRKGNSDVATYDYDNEKLINIFEKRGYKRKRGSMTDVAILSKHTGIACINLSVGFYNEHTPREYIKIEDTLKTLKILTDEELIEKLKIEKFEVKKNRKYFIYDEEIENLIGLL